MRFNPDAVLDASEVRWAPPPSLWSWNTWQPWSVLLLQAIGTYLLTGVAWALLKDARDLVRTVGWRGVARLAREYCLTVSHGARIVITEARNHRANA